MYFERNLCNKNNVNKKVYIGKSINLYDRLCVHKSTLRSNIHDNSHLQRAFNKHREASFEFFVLIDDDALTDEELIVLEKLMILLFQSSDENYGYNKTQGGQGGCLGYNHSDEAKIIISMNNAKNKSVMIDNVIYRSISEAIRVLDLKVDHRTVSRRCQNPREKWNNYHFID
ncbi:hypothetical protein BTO30_01300 [Domibacillus antri]|uniref:GIY-YIG domain-containing protein n=1 Tax=Domibacillus antri TaxID=1714264 RepID=A0A1Q8Q9U9_9BACI|nr:GIY-YIG nuclease family protein [Domibacillus antri]OLN24081.1 hypothetical protein BTO30_01300 [Domibacillus antri]